jgi:hypothetical protein
VTRQPKQPVPEVKADAVPASAPAKGTPQPAAAKPAKQEKLEPAKKSGTGSKSVSHAKAGAPAAKAKPVSVHVAKKPLNAHAPAKAAKAAPAPKHEVKRAPAKPPAKAPLKAAIKTAPKGVPKPTAKHAPATKKHIAVARSGKIAKPIAKKHSAKPAKKR